MIFQIFSFGVIGILAGILSGLLGIGGGVVTIPCLVLVFSKLDIPQGAMMHLAIGTSLAAMVFNTFSGSYTHHKKQAVLLYIVKPMALGVILGAILGATAANFLSSHFLQIFFGIFEILLGIRFFLPDSKTSKKHPLPSFWPLSTISFCVTAFSTLLGIGGGMVNVPILSHFGVPVKKAIGTSSALSFLISFCGAVFFLLLGMHSTKAPDTVGFLYIPAFLIISVVSFFTAPYGAKLAHRLPTKVLKKIFAMVLLAAGIVMVMK
ncbi:sulfite exporter TauE/SafE family protein [Candidatus Neptunichlamydia sp. REUL1]|uniref:sulfite exporter TauE/SafE family protein n=1 Tax=Candidatus Neptunichlamydia sp. REUL1 TaxID=3064277 RepID=UPI00292FEA32|nr:sulfite exporter TauE/SafE family protein [Candidatus Neptunochlamydia sp. REUL1]